MTIGVISVGQPVPWIQAPMPETAQINLHAGQFYIVEALHGISEFEVRLFREGVVRFAQRTGDHAIFFYWGFELEGERVWRETVFDAHLCADPRIQWNEGRGHFTVPMVLADAESGVCKALRFVTMSNVLSLEMALAVNDQLARPSNFKAVQQEAQAFWSETYGDIERAVAACPIQEIAGIND